MEQRPQLSDDEIRTYMNFDRLLAERKLAVKPKFHSLKWIVPGIVIIGVTAWLILDKTDANTQEQAANINDPQAASTLLPSDSITSLKVDSTPAPPKNEPNEIKPSLKKSTPRTEQKTTGNVERVDSPDDQIYIQAEPADGYPALYAYFNSNLVYPMEALSDSIQGVETVSFTINTEGKAENITIRQSLGAPFEKEARRLIENMPLWKPATVDGTPVASKMSIPLTFNIQKVKATH